MKFPLTLRRFVSIYFFISALLFIAIRLYVVNDESQTQTLRPKARRNFLNYLKYDFQLHWFRQRQARVDWRAILRPCVNYTQWAQSRPGWGKENRTNASMSHISFRDIKPAGEFSRIFIQSRTVDGFPKMVGGDFWRVNLRGPSNSSVDGTLIDHNNGTYEALFLIIEPGLYKLTCHLDYSLCDGLKEPPSDWFIKGNAHGEFQKEGTLGDLVLDEYLQVPFSSSAEHITIFPRRFNISHSALDLFPEMRSCRRSCRFLWDGFGRWVNKLWQPYLDYKDSNWITPQNRRSGTLWVYGDSLGVRLFLSIQFKRLCTAVYSKCGNSYNWVYPVNNEQEDKRKWDGLDFQPQKVLNTIRVVLERKDMNTAKSTLLINLGLHFTISLNFSTYRHLIGDFIAMIQEKELSSNGDFVPKYKTRIIWKTTTAIHKEEAKALNTTKWRFFTPQRVQLYNAYATSAMCEAGVEIIDVYPLTASWPEGTLGDVVHYGPEVFASVEKLLETIKLNSAPSHRIRSKGKLISQCIET